VFLLLLFQFVFVKNVLVNEQSLFVLSLFWLYKTSVLCPPPHHTRRGNRCDAVHVPVCKGSLVIHPEAYVASVLPYVITGGLSVVECLSCPSHKFVCHAGIIEYSKSKFDRFEVSRAMTVKNAVFWDIKPKFVLHRRHVTFPLQSSAG
jgi:hypothetical protein